MLPFRFFHRINAVAVPGWRRVMAAWLLWGLTGCDQLGIETPLKAAEHAHADSKAVGGACRHALRAIEDCYTLNPKADKSAVYEGWREMDEYMRENKLEGVVPVVPRPAPPASAASAPKKPASEEEDAEETEDDTPVKKKGDKGGKSAEKGSAKAAGKGH